MEKRAVWFGLLLISVSSAPVSGAGEVALGPLFFDDSGNIRFEAPGGSSFLVSPEGRVEVDGQLLVICSDRPGAKVKSPRAVAKCYPSFIKVEDDRGSVLKVYENFVKAEDGRGQEWMIRPDQRVGASGASSTAGDPVAGNPVADSPVTDGPISGADEPRDRSTPEGEPVDVGEGSHSLSQPISSGKTGLRIVTPGATIGLGEESGIEVRTPGATVSLGKNLRIQTPAGDTEVSGDWRQQGPRSSSPAETDRLLTSLGANWDGGSLRIELAGDVLFDFDRSVIRPDAAATLSKVARVLRLKLVGPALVSGHTDDLGSVSYNQRLSEQRALAVMTWLHEKEGVPIDLLHGEGHGASKPIAANRLLGQDNPTGRALNRRVEILVPTEERSPESS